jgi:hypothetical protein
MMKEKQSNIRQPQKAYWNKHPGEYRRHRVDKEVLNFMGWQKLEKLIKAAEDLPTNFDDRLVFADALAVAFATAGRINEWTQLRTSNFYEYDTHFEVIDMIVEKRYKKIGHSIICLRCETENDKFEMTCKSCGANLMYAGRKKWQTVPVEEIRIPFKFPKTEPTTIYIKRRLALAKQKGWSYLFLNPATQKPISDVCFYDHFVLVGKRCGIDMWPHRQRAERCKQLREEYKFEDNDLRRFTMIISEKTLRIYAGTSKPYEQKMGLS